MTRRIVAAGMAIATAFAAFGQSADAPLKFEVASIKPVAPTLDNRYMIRLRVNAGELNYSAASLKAITQQAYEVRGFQVSGPDWMTSTRFDVVAKLPVGAPQSRVPEMLRSLLAERFKLTSHVETRDLPMYALVVAKGVIKMKGSAADPEAPAGWTINKGPGHLEGHRMNMSSLANNLSALLGRQVVDQTGLNGSYDFDLQYAPDELAGPDPDRMPLLDAVQSQLGLKLEARKGPVKVIVIDHIEKTPTEN
jgi:uncharacterized protein (TIGR03435 family)